MYKRVTVANLITGSRLVFFVLFVWAAHVQAMELLILLFFLAWSLDIIDGWVARKMGQATSFGYIFDKIVDRIVVFIGLMVLLINGLVPDYALLILVKDIAVLPAASAQLSFSRAMPSMGYVGKITATAQGAVIIWLLAGLPAGLWLVGLVAGLGGVAGARHLYYVYYEEEGMKVA